MKKIGCVIAYGENHNNYGTSLQGYATIKKILDFGYDCEIIRYKKEISLYKKIYLLLQMFRCGGHHDKIRILKEKIYKVLIRSYRRNIGKRTLAVNEYKREKLIPFFSEYVGFESLSNGSIKYDAVLVGSDQVWTPMSLYGKFYNLLFVKDNIRKISYASSFGVSKIPEFQRMQTKNYLNRIENIGVREVSGKKIVDSLIHKEAKVVVDPTMLLTQEEWHEEIKEEDIGIFEPYIFCYFLGNNKISRNAVNELQRMTNLKIVTFRHMDEYIASDETFGDFYPYDVSPNKFLKFIQNADYVCSDSFHCAVFSIIFHKKFLSFYRFKETSKNSRNTRIDNLLGLVGLKSRLFSGNNINQIKSEIDYDDADLRLNKLRDDSLLFLKSALNHNS